MFSKANGLLVIVVIILSVVFSGICVNQVLAYDFESRSGISETGTEAGYEEANLTDVSVSQIISKAVRQVIIYIGVFFFLLTLYAGFIWMFSRGNEQEIEKAKKILQNAVIGLIVILMAYAITYLVSVLMP